MAGISYQIQAPKLSGLLDLNLAQRLRLHAAAARGMDKYVPMDTGTLRRFVEPTEYGVHYAVDYATYAESPRGTIHTDKNPSAVAHWPKAYEASGMREVTQELEAILRESL